MNKNHIFGQYTTVAVASAAFVFFLYWVIQDTLSRMPDSLLLKVLAGTGTYFIVFKMLIFFYVKYLWRYFNISTYIGGGWIYTYDVFGNEGDLKRKDCPGEAFIIHTMEGIHISAESGDPSKRSNASSIKTLWDTTSCFLLENRVIAGLEFSNEKGTGLGFLIIHIIRDSPKRPFVLRPRELRGHYVFLEGSDVSRGRVVFRRQKAGFRDVVR